MNQVLKISLAFIITISFTVSITAQNKVRWISWEEALSANEKEPRKFVVDIYTKWCGWCKKMDKATFQKDYVASYINKNYYAIKFDAETDKKIFFKGEEYNLVTKGRKKYHELAVAITQGQLSYPTVVFLDEHLTVIQPINGFQDAKTFELIMTYFAGNHYKDIPWNSYTSTYNRNTTIHTVKN
ncbi:MAG: DUF255 domain-containing protein [Saprospiraceae bacterium]